MRRRLQALACLGGLAAMTIPASSPEILPATTRTEPAAARVELAPRARAAARPEPAAQAVAAACRVVASRPVLGPRGVIRATATRTGCDGRARLRVRLKQAVRGRDRVLKSGSKVLENGRITATLPCTATPRHYYVTALDNRGSADSSRSVKLSCRRSSAPDSAADRAGASAAEAAVVRLTNQARARKGCRPLVHDRKLRKAAVRHSADMAAKRYFDHTGLDGRSAGDRIRAAGFRPIRAWGENIAMGARTASQVVRGWLNSPGHRRNIMDCSFTHIGVGHHPRGPHWTQVFARH
jgi:uncharacterized protein YkwD